MYPRAEETLTCLVPIRTISDTREFAPRISLGCSKISYVVRDIATPMRDLEYESGKFLDIVNRAPRFSTDDIVLIRPEVVHSGYGMDSSHLVEILQYGL
ncbi:hypothetical protein CVT25_013610 [Psilocybe cyanescens]|uniref:Uncharacterized protein n=1 Tax=Psilocybe cyanescens TaxID=93625 RepID=A0A409WSZ4_PSICY|nr:hypothetical protein CVT25_013610 [Psilocybe cyanescens]